LGKQKKMFNLERNETDEWKSVKRIWIVVLLSSRTPERDLVVEGARATLRLPYDLSRVHFGPTPRVV
jgi:hypothetical protein